MTKCKHCGEQLLFHENARTWYHKHSERSSCELKAEPLIEWVTPTSGPKLPEVEVRNSDDEEWEKAELLFVDHREKHPYCVRLFSGNVIGISLCRIRKENEE